MAQMTQDLNLNQVVTLLNRYKFEMKGHNLQELIEQWLPIYPVRWIRLAVVEALYQGRYKVISVEHILSLWLRRGHPTFHFNHEFERMVCNNLLGSVMSSSRTASKRYFKQPTLPSVHQVDSAIAAPPSPDEQTEGLAEEIPELSPSSELQIVTVDAEEIFVLDGSAQDEPTLIENPPLETPPTKLSDVKELFAQLITQDNLSEMTTADDLNQEAKREIHYRNTIHEFSPHLDHSALYTKLKAVLQQSL